MPITPTQDALIRAWQDAAANLKIAKGTEAAAREMMLKECYPQHKPGSELEGTHSIELGNGFKLKGTFGTAYTVDKDALPDVLADLAAAGEAGEHAADKLFRYKPELAVTSYKLLMPSIKAIVDNCITAKPSLPSFEIVEPKAKGK